MQMPKVNDCQVDACAYNEGHACHALAITIGNATNPDCDTFFDHDSKGGDASATAGVGACKVSACKFNQSLECSAESIQVGKKSGHAYCMTYSM
ncbi:MAG: DUF1540 domain-containing protein [Phycisphaerae bacterium]